MTALRTVLLGVLVAVSVPARGQAPAFILTPPVGSPVSYAAGLQVSFSVPVQVTQTGNSITISWGTVPTPPPPGPPPAPATGPLYVLAMFDAKTPGTPAQIAVQTSTTIAPALAGLAASTTTWAVGDVASPAFAAWSTQAKAAGIPALVVISVDANGKGTLVEAIPLPTPESALVAEIKRIRGLP